MCGIVAIKGPNANQNDIQIMNSVLRHRGPDDEGYFVGERIAMGMRRLSIIDLHTGKQPIFSDDGKLCIIQNGELYNYKELRKKIGTAYPFKTQSDTEVILASYRLYGIDCLNQFNGMFAFIIWDNEKRELFAARDRIGVKPLYYYQDKDNLVIASEIKSIVTLPWVERELDLIAIQQFMVFEYIPAPRTIFKSIKKFLSGHYILNNDHTMQSARYWHIPVVQNDDKSFDHACREFKSVFRDSVRLRLVSDVPVGLFLSGGIDSSTIAAEMRAVVPNGELHSFSIGFEDSAYDESRYAQIVASKFNFTHHHKILKEKNVDRLLQEIFEILDEPLADASIIPTYFVSQLAKQYVKVVLSGDGGDEAFLGYSTYKAHLMTNYIPPFLKPPISIILKKLMAVLPISDNHMGYQFKLFKYLRGFGHSSEICNAIWWGAYNLSELKRLLEIEINPEEIFEPINRYYSEVEANDILKKISFLDLNLYLQDDLLVKVDRMSMANSVEVRNPYIDYRILEFAFNIPSNWKLHPVLLRSKHIIKKSYESILPNVILKKPKKGFDIPLTRLLRDALYRRMNHFLSPNQIAKTNIFNSREIEKIKKKHIHQEENNRQLIWPLMVFQMWFNNYAE